MGIHVFIKWKFLHLYLQFFYIFYAISINDTCPRSGKSISVPNFDKTHQSTAEIKLLPVFETDCHYTEILPPVTILAYAWKTVYFNTRLLAEIQK